MMETYRPPLRARGFTLVELLVVIGVMILLLALAMPALNTLLLGRRVDIAGQLVNDQLILARQMALSSNRNVEVRLYHYPKSSGQPKTWSAIQIFEQLENGQRRPAGKMVTMPESIAMNATAEYSTLLNLAADYALAPTEKIPLPGLTASDYEGIVFRFRPGGSTDLPDQTGNYFVTLHAVTEKPEAPVNFVTVQIDPVNGRVRSFRP